MNQIGGDRASRRDRGHAGRAHRASPTRFVHADQANMRIFGKSEAWHMAKSDEEDLRAGVGSAYAPLQFARRLPLLR